MGSGSGGRIDGDKDTLLSTIATEQNTTLYADIVRLQTERILGVTPSLDGDPLSVHRALVDCLALNFDAQTRRANGLEQVVSAKPSEGVELEFAHAMAVILESLIQNNTLSYLG